MSEEVTFVGKIKMYNDQKGFGFIADSEGGEDIFFHISNIPLGYIPVMGEKVSGICQCDESYNRDAVVSLTDWPGKGEPVQVVATKTLAASSAKTVPPAMVETPIKRGDSDQSNTFLGKWPIKQ